MKNLSSDYFTGGLIWVHLSNLRRRRQVWHLWIQHLWIWGCWWQIVRQDFLWRSSKIYWDLFILFLVCTRQWKLINKPEFQNAKAGKPEIPKVCPLFKVIWRLVVCAKQIQLLEWRFLLNCRAIFLTFWSSNHVLTCLALCSKSFKESYAVGSF